MTSKGDFPYFKKYQAKFKSSRTNPVCNISFFFFANNSNYVRKGIDIQSLLKKLINFKNLFNNYKIINIVLDLFRLKCSIFIAKFYS